jgi:hypothetical protein
LKKLFKAMKTVPPTSILSIKNKHLKKLFSGDF